MFAYYLQARQRATRAACHEKYMIPNSFCARKPRIIRFAEKSHNIPRIVAASPAPTFRTPPVIPSAACHSEHRTLSFRAKRGIFPPSQSVRGVRGDALAAVPQAASVKSPAICDNYQGIPRSHRSARSRPLTLCEGGVPSQHPLSFRAAHCHSERSTPCHSERSEESSFAITPSFHKFPPSQSVRGVRGDALAAVPQAASVKSPAICDNYQGIPRSHRSARSRPLTLREGGVPSRTYAHHHLHLHPHLPPAHDIR